MKAMNLMLLSAALSTPAALAQTASAVPTPSAAVVIPAAAAAHGEIYPLPHALRIVLAGDSTVNHTTGWGTAFCERQATDTECFNSSRNGRSAKSYREQGLWDRALAVRPDYILIQFGANDGPGKGPLLEDVPATTFSDYMRADRTANTSALWRITPPRCALWARKLAPLCST
jgi:lysophospholipase L1-like esterase